MSPFGSGGATATAGTAAAAAGAALLITAVTVSVAVVWRRRRSRKGTIDVRCPVCLERLDDLRSYVVRSPACGHAFHLQCLRKAWISGHRNCPCCRCELPSLSDGAAEAHAVETIESLEGEKKRLVDTLHVTRLALLESERQVATMTTSFEQLQAQTSQVVADFQQRISKLQDQLKAKADKSEVDALIKAEVEHLQGLLAEKANREDLEMLMQKIRSLENVMEQMVLKYETKIARLHKWQMQQHSSLSTKLALYHQIVKSICAVSPSLRRLIGKLLEHERLEGGLVDAANDEALAEQELREEDCFERCDRCAGACACEAEPKAGAGALLAPVAVGGPAPSRQEQAVWPAPAAQAPHQPAPGSNRGEAEAEAEAEAEELPVGFFTDGD